MSHAPQYRTIEEKVQDIERYLIRQIDTIRRWVMVAVGLTAVTAIASVWLALGSNRSESPGDIAMVTGSEVTAGMSADDFDEESSEPASADDKKTLAAKKSTPSKKTSAAKSGTSRPVERESEKPTSEKKVETAAIEPPKKVASETSTAAVRAPEPVIQAPAASPRPADTAPPPPAETVRRDSGQISGMAPAASITSPTWSFRIGASAIATSIDDHEPMGTADRFPARLRQLYCWTRVETDDLTAIPADRRFITHRWIQNGRLERERTITIGSTSYRVHSALPNPGKYPGAWRVDIVDSEGRMLGTERFFIEPEL